MSTHPQRGAVLLPFIFAACSFCVVMGTIVESTLLLHARNRMFNDAESALLAAASLYVENQDQSDLNTIMKEQYANKNFLDAGVTELDFSQIDDDILLISTSKNIPFLFLPADITVQASLAATVPLPAGDIEGAAPIAMQEPEGGFVFGVPYTIRAGAGDGTEGNYGSLNLSGPGSANYEDDLTNGYPGSIAIEDVISTQTGNMAGGTRDAIEYRLGTPSEDDDVILVVITEDMWPHGSSAPITVSGFAAFRVTGYNHPGQITGEFIKYKMSAEPASEACNCEYGLYTRAKLTYH